MKNVCYLHHNGFLIFEHRLVILTVFPEIFFKVSTLVSKINYTLGFRDIRY
jgi:hypothetical protein